MAGSGFRDWMQRGTTPDLLVFQSFDNVFVWISGEFGDALVAADTDCGLEFGSHFGVSFFAAHRTFARLCIESCNFFDLAGRIFVELSFAGSGAKGNRFLVFDRTAGALSGDGTILGHGSCTGESEGGGEDKEGGENGFHDLTIGCCLVLFVSPPEPKRPSWKIGQRCELCTKNRLLPNTE